ncbi:MAG: Nif3-like dinuclear metal center hexameric protein [Chitinophagaceae bacterium]|nr:Nif3-like dinuclear metal center hexameric protein [Chitinophagaceae bacterium]
MPVRITNQGPSYEGWKRRDFLTAALSVLAGTSLLKPVAARAKERGAGDMTIRQAIDRIVADVPGAPFATTVDTIKSGDPGQPLKGIVTTMFATDAVIEKTIGQGANLIIAHEPTFYNHLDETEWLEKDKVYAFKKDLLEKNNIVVWRFHDYWHSVRPDGILMGVLSAMGWNKYYNEGAPEIITIPSVSLKEIVRTAKKELGIDKMRVIGDLSASCQRIVLLPGAAGGRRQIDLLRKYEPDLLICGELNEWETSEYIRDARYQGRKVALIVLGHSVSEEPGMQGLVSWLGTRLPGVPVKHIPSGDPFIWA